MLIGCAGALLAVLLVIVPASAAPKATPRTAAAAAPKFVIYTGYADCPSPTICYATKLTNPRFAQPWLGAAHLNFIGSASVGNPKKDDDPDTSAIRVDNTGTTTITISKVSVHGCGSAINLWGTSPFKYPYKLGPGRIDVFTSTDGNNFDGSEICSPDPTVTVTINGKTGVYKDRVANAGNGAIIGGDYSADSGDESTPWTKVSGLAVGIVVLPATVPTATVGKSFFVELAAQDSNGAPTWKISSGALPPGVKFAATGQDAEFYGKPTKAGTYKVVLHLSDKAAHADAGNRTYTIVVK
jgi:hypothetical protein